MTVHRAPSNVASHRARRFRPRNGRCGSSPVRGTARPPGNDGWASTQPPACSRQWSWSSKPAMRWSSTPCPLERSTWTRQHQGRLSARLEPDGRCCGRGVSHHVWHLGGRPVPAPRPDRVVNVALLEFDPDACAEIRDHPDSGLIPSDGEARHGPLTRQAQGRYAHSKPTLRSGSTLSATVPRYCRGTSSSRLLSVRRHFATSRSGHLNSVGGPVVKLSRPRQQLPEAT